MRRTDRLVGEPPVVLWLGYSAFRSSPEFAGLEDRKYRTDLDVGRRVVAALRAHGLDALEPETPDDRIAIAITDWRKPVPESDDGELEDEESEPRLGIGERIRNLWRR